MRLRAGKMPPRRGDVKSPLQFVSDLAQKIFAEFDVGFGFDAFGFQAVDDAEDTAPLLGLGDNDLDGIRRGAENPAHFRDVLDGVQDVDRKAAIHKDDEAMATSER
jgi:hypothetical protein